MVQVVVEFLKHIGNILEEGQFYAWIRQCPYDEHLVGHALESLFKAEVGPITIYCLPILLFKS